MTSSGTYSFFSSNADTVMGAYSRLQIRRTEMVAEHLTDAAHQANLLMVEFANKQPNLWTSELQTIPLIAGTATYTLPARTIMVLICYLRTGTGVSQNDRVLWPQSTVEYGSIPNKNDQGFPSIFWFNRQITPQITFYLVPDQTGVYTAELQVVRQIQDINLASGETSDLPYRWLDAFEAGLAHRLARSYKPELEAIRKQDFNEAWTIAATQDVENVALNIVPSLSQYYNGQG